MIDRDLQNIIEAMTAAGFAMPRPLQAETMRAVANAAMEGVPIELPVVRDIEVPGGEGLVPARLYRAEKEGNLPVTFLFHGGGWVVGTLDTADAMARTIARDTHGAVISVDYRLAPEHRYPAAFEDCLAAVEALPNLSGDYDLDASRFALCGDSAGGNLAAVVALALAERGGPRPLRQVLLYPVIDRDMERESYRRAPELPLLDREMMSFFSQAYLGDQEGDRFVFPLMAEDLSGLAPAQVIVAGQDPLHDEGLEYAMKMRDAGVSVDFHDFDTATHGFASFAGMAPIGDVAMALVSARLRSDFAHAG